MLVWRLAAADRISDLLVIRRPVPAQPFVARLPRLAAVGRLEEAVALDEALERYERKKNLAMVAQVRPRLEALRTSVKRRPEHLDWPREESNLRTRIRSS